VMLKVVNITTPLIYLPKTKAGNKCMWKCMRIVTFKAPLWNEWFIIYFLPIYIWSYNAKSYYGSFKIYLFSMIVSY